MASAQSHLSPGSFWRAELDTVWDVSGVMSSYQWQHLCSNIEY